MSKINNFVEDFYGKNSNENYGQTYDSQHDSRLNWVVQRFGLDRLQNQRIIDIGCGKGNYFKRMNSNNYFVGLDGALIGEKLCDFLSLRVNLNDQFGNLFDNEQKFDFLICSEVIEHVSQIDNIMLEMKKILKENCKALFTIPHESVTHPVAFPGLFFPESNFKVFIEQYAWIVEDFDIFQNGWKTCCFMVRNAPMKEQKPLYPKSESKFWGLNPIDWTNI